MVQQTQTWTTTLFDLAYVIFGMAISGFAIVGPWL